MRERISCSSVAKGNICLTKEQGTTACMGDLRLLQEGTLGQQQTIRLGTLFDLGYNQVLEGKMMCPTSNICLSKD